jgi:hypothetical protein
MRGRSARPPRLPGRPAALAVAGTVTALLAACGTSPEPQAAAQAAPASTRPAAKQTCADVTWTPPRETGLRPTGRDLVGFGPTLLGVHTTWSGDGLSAETIAGGYVDDLTEPYDDLHLVRTARVEPGLTAEVLHGQLVGNSVLVVVWRDPAQHPPCDVRVLAVSGADADRVQDDDMIRGLGG